MHCGAYTCSLTLLLHIEILYEVSCGSGMTASVVALALRRLAIHAMQEPQEGTVPAYAAIYDGSYAEWGSVGDGYCHGYLGDIIQRKS